MPGAMAAGFRRFWVGEAVSGFGTAITLLALQTIVVLNLQGTALQVGGSPPRVGCPISSV